VKWARQVLGLSPDESSDALAALDKSGVVAVDLLKYSAEGLGEKLGAKHSIDEMEMIVSAIRYINDRFRRECTH